MHIALYALLIWFSFISLVLTINRVGAVNGQIQDQRLSDMAAWYRGNEGH